MARLLRGRPGTARSVIGSGVLHHLMHNHPSPIGVFDSGVGGLSVLKAIRSALPNEHLLYVADSANAPYGDRDAGFIEDRAMAMAGFLAASNAKAIVVACNTATVVAVERLRASFSIPVVAMVPAIKPAVELTRTRVIGVLATSRTLESPAVARLCALYARETEIILQPCPGLVEQVESGDTGSERTRELLERYLTPLLAAGADALVLGCAHYAFLEPQILEMVGPEVCIVESAIAVARQLERRLGGNGNPEPRGSGVTETFYTTGAVGKMQDLVSQLWGARVRIRNVEEAPRT